MFKLSQEEIDKMEEEVKELKKKIDRLEWFIRINEHKVYEGGSDLHLDYNRPNNIDENRWTNNKTLKQIEDEYNKSMNIIYTSPFECCKNCPNNFKNNPSGGGVCSCDLSYHEMFKW
jgi:hypothetical protein